ncbi:MAG: hypothetical protein ACE5FA_00265 [Dehalococcoidia bacterium]
MAIRRMRLSSDAEMLRYLDPATGETLRVEAPIFFKEDFLGDNVVTDGTLRWLFTETSPAGGPGTIAIVDDGLGGQVLMSIASASNEQASARIDFGDNLQFDPSKGLFFEARVALSKAASVYAATDVLIGLASAHNIAADSIVSHVWFRLVDGYDLMFETDDGTLDDDDNDLGVDVAEDTFNVLTFDATDLSRIKVYVDGVRKPDGNTTFNASALTASEKLQPYIAVNRRSGTLLPDLLVDSVLVAQGGR